MEWYGKPKMTTTPRYSFNDVFIEPKYSLVRSRKDVDTSFQLWGTKIDVPVISANMDTVTDGEMAAEMANAGALGAIHRFLSVKDQVLEFRSFLERTNVTPGSLAPCLVAIGTKEEERERFEALYQAGARWFVVDIAHGASYNMETMVEWLNNQRATDQSVKILAGNVATSACARTLIEMGVDGIKVGIGPGAVCTTKNVTGVTVPQFSAIMDCVNATRSVSQDVVVVADGGIVEYGDIAKALGAGADLVMSGKLFVQTTSSVAYRKHGGNDFDEVMYRGMASVEAMSFFHREDLPTPEGKSTKLKATGLSATKTVSAIKGALQSSFSYSNSLNLPAFQKNCTFGVRYTSL